MEENNVYDQFYISLLANWFLVKRCPIFSYLNREIISAHTILNIPLTLNVILFVYKMNTLLVLLPSWMEKKHNVINFLLSIFYQYLIYAEVYPIFIASIFSMSQKSHLIVHNAYVLLMIIPPLSLSLPFSLYTYIYIPYHQKYISRILYNVSIVTSSKRRAAFSHILFFLAGFTNVTAFRGDFAHDTANASSKGRRTVKGIPGSSLPLETTLRVVSELGPTLRMERGKVIRMYACPWCLRHFTRKENLKLHVRYIHGPLESLTCKLCGNKYKNSNSLRVHSYLYHNAKRDKQHSKSVTAGGDDGGDA